MTYSLDLEGWEPPQSEFTSPEVIQDWLAEVAKIDQDVAEKVQNVMRNPDSDQYWSWLSETLASLRDHTSDAISCALYAATKEGYFSAKNYVFLGMIYNRDGKTEEAINYFKYALSINPSPVTWSLLIEAHVKLGEYQKALEAIEFSKINVSKEMMIHVCTGLGEFQKVAEMYLGQWDRDTISNSEITSLARDTLQFVTEHHAHICEDTSVKLVARIINYAYDIPDARKDFKVAAALFKGMKIENPYWFVKRNIWEEVAPLIEPMRLEDCGQQSLSAEAEEGIRNHTFKRGFNKASDLIGTGDILGGIEMLKAAIAEYESGKSS